MLEQSNNAAQIKFTWHRNVRTEKEAAQTAQTKHSQANVIQEVGALSEAVDDYFCIAAPTVRSFKYVRVSKVTTCRTCTLSENGS